MIMERDKVRHVIMYNSTESVLTVIIIEMYRTYHENPGVKSIDLIYMSFFLTHHVCIHILREETEKELNLSNY